MKTRSTRSAISALILAAAWSIIAAALSATAAMAAADDVTWTVRTASSGLGADRTSFSYAINPGQKVEDALVVSNHGSEPITLNVYAADGFTTDSGGFDILTAEQASTGIGAWVHAAQASLTVAPGASQTTVFSLSVPDNATPGDYAGGIVTSLTQGDAAEGINVDRRLGIRVELRVGGDLAPAMAVEDPHLGWQAGANPFGGGSATLTYTLHNTGNATLSAKQTASAAGPFGWFRTDAAGIDAPPTLLPGERWEVTVPIDDVPSAVWLQASGSVTPVVVDASGSTTPLSAVSIDATGWAVPWLALLILVLAAALIVLAVLLARRQKARRGALEDARVEEAVKRALDEQGQNGSSGSMPTARNSSDR